MPLSWTDLLTPSQQPGMGRGNNSAIAQLLMQQSMDNTPIQSPVQGLAKLAQAYVAKSMMRDDENKYGGMVNALMGSNQINPVQVTPQVSQPNLPQLPGGAPISDPGRQAAYNAPTQSYDGPLGQQMGSQAGTMAALLEGLPADEGIRLLPQIAMGQMNRQQELADKKITPISGTEASGIGLRQGGVYGRDAAGNIVPIQQSDMKSQGAIDQANTQAHLTPITDPNDPRLPPMNARPPGTMYGTDAAGNVAPIIKSDAKSPIAEKQAQDERSAAAREQMAIFAGSNPNSAIDPTSGSLQAQTGLSQAALNSLMYGQNPRGQAAYMAVNKEIDDFSRRTGVNTATLRAQAKGYNDVLTNNLHRNNQAQILENEIQGSVQNLAPLADAIKSGRLNVANVANLWLGKQVNDPVVQQYRDQLLRLREELAGYNAVAGGKLTENGTARVDDGDLRGAGEVLASGINSGGLQGLSKSIEASTAKNKAVLGTAIDDANQNMWGLFGVGKNYKRQSAPVSQGGQQPHPQDQAAVAWARSNPKDPRSAAILKANGL